jgi:hypothetical protein
MQFYKSSFSFYLSERKVNIKTALLNGMMKSKKEKKNLI